MKMNYYIQGDAEKADKIKAAFEKLGIDASGYDFGNDNFLFFTYDLVGEGKVITTANVLHYFANIIKSHPDYKELELPVEPKFKVGDWIVANDIGIVSQITKVINDTDEYGEYHAYEHTNGYFAACFENEYHLWTIQDAKDGDVLVCSEGSIFIYNGKCGQDTLGAYGGMLCHGFEIAFSADRWTPIHGVKPATKEQRDLLFAKMKEAGYQWDADKKELRKIKPHYNISDFKAGMPVLVRILDKHKWCYLLFSHCYKHQGILHFQAGGAGWLQCIPFNKKTKHLLGTSDMPSEEYINW